MALTEKEMMNIINSVKENLKKNGISLSENEIGKSVIAFLNSSPFLSLDEAVQKITDQIIEGMQRKKRVESVKLESATQTKLELDKQMESYFDLYKWACRLTAEQKEEENYVPSKEARMLLRRLLTTRGNLIAVIGLQGSGKTALRQWLLREILKAERTAYSAKWTSEDELVRNILGELSFEGFYEDDEYLENLRIEFIKKLYGSLKQPLLGPSVSEELLKIFKSKLKGKEIDILTGWLLKKDVELNEKVISAVEEFLGKSKVNFLREELIKGKIETADTILIDFPDYDKNSRGRMIKDLENFQAWWEENIAHYEGYEQGPNIVIFFQKELFSGHFSFGKFDVIELKPWSAESLADYVNKNFPGHPFSQEALLKVAALSNGIWRRFKKYIRICLDYAMDEGINTITVEHVKKWISLEQLMKDMELELMDIFPKNKELRKKAVIVLQTLQEKGKIDQPSITEEIFDGNKMQASRVLNALESYGYISCRYENRVKVWSVEKWK